MRHGVAGKKFGRDTSWRKATVRDLAKATLLRQRIRTTLAKAKEARKLVDRLITMAKKGTLAHRRRAFSILCDHKLVSDLFNRMAPRFRQRVGGYTRIIPFGKRRGDNASMVFLELTEKEEIILSKPRKKAAESKIKDTSVPGKAVKPVPEHGKEEVLTEKKPETPKSAPPQEPKRPKGIPEGPKQGKKFMGGIRKMFQRKVTE